MIHPEAKSGKLKTRILTLMTDDGVVEWQNGVEEIHQINNGIGRTRIGNFKLIGGIVRTKDDKIWIPKIQRSNFITKTHLTLCHAGAEKVKSYIKNSFDMENMNMNIKEVIETCDSFHKQKVITTKTKENIIQNIPSRTFEHIFVDICRSMKTTWHQEKYIFAIIDQFSK